MALPLATARTKRVGSRRMARMSPYASPRSRLPPLRFETPSVPPGDAVVAGAELPPPTESSAVEANAARRDGGRRPGVSALGWRHARFKGNVPATHVPKRAASARDACMATAAREERF